MIPEVIKKKFKKGSITYYYSSLFFPPSIKQDVFVLYAFVRTIDDFIDRNPQDKSGLKSFLKAYQKALLGTPSGLTIIDAFVSLSLRRDFDTEMIEAFLRSMESDLRKTTYLSISDLEDYIYGSAEVIGIIMAKILQLPDASLPYAKMLGKSMQFANFIRDIQEDLDLNRQYIPESDLKKHKLKSLKKSEVIRNPQAFEALITYECDRFDTWQKEAEKGFIFIPKRSRVAIKTASDMYKWTISEIRKNPMIIYDKQIKPPIWRVVSTAFINSLLPN